MFHLLLPLFLTLLRCPPLIGRYTFFWTLQSFFRLLSRTGKVHAQEPFSIPVLVSVKEIKTTVAADKAAKLCSIPRRR